MSFGTLSKTSGSKGTNKITYTAPRYTGRNSRVVQVLGKTADDANVTSASAITQKGKELFLTSSNNTALGTVPNTANEVTINLVTNGAKLKVYPTQSYISVKSVGFKKSSDPNYTNLTVGSNEVYTIPNDPGTTDQVSVKVVLIIAANPDANTRELSPTIYAALPSWDGTTSAVGTTVGVNFTGTQAAASPTISITPATATVSADGGTVELTLISNDDWTLALQDVSKAVSSIMSVNLEDHVDATNPPVFDVGDEESII